MAQIQLPTLQSPNTSAARTTCALNACAAGTRVTVVDIECSGDEACRLRALGFCEGTSVNVIDARDAMLLEVRGTRLALGSALTAGITVQPAIARA
ncbi:FeoA family protein [Gemmatimonas groenlandica]|uniref:Ferrous iron transport protein A n=1 Tax=Gemmatimonas groenlandica TaxID=2732249 RepID=A0A6M4IPY7_9BACT|nr:FeoA family protein [Gemmatimonas groenlandica]QJR36155.1 ferrous iron transport protein A [Gemmatimonas groenlandica]